MRDEHNRKICPKRLAGCRVCGKEVEARQREKHERNCGKPAVPSSASRKKTAKVAGKRTIRVDPKDAIRREENASIFDAGTGKPIPETPAAARRKLLKEKSLQENKVPIRIKRPHLSGGLPQ